jgi:hypothetical protein
VTDYSDNPKIQDTEEAYKIVEEAETLLKKLGQLEKGYRTVTEAFLHPENISSNTQYNLGEIADVEANNPEKISHDCLVEYSEILSKKIDKASQIRNKLERIDASSLSENQVINGETIDRSSFMDEIEDLLDGYYEVERSIWNTDMRLRESKKTEFNLIERRLKRERRANRKNTGRMDEFELSDYWAQNQLNT